MSIRELHRTYGEGMTSNASDGPPRRHWTFLTNHTHVLLCLTEGTESTVRELARRVDITERAVQMILADLVEEGYVTKTRVGRRNTYSVNPQGRLRHPLESHHTVGELLAALR